MPGSPPRRIMDPPTIPPPRTLSSSLNPVENLSSAFSSTALRGTGFLSGPLNPGVCPAKTAPALLSGAGASVMVFHSLQAGHWPTHLADSCPQLLQKNTVLIFLAIKVLQFCSCHFISVHNRSGNVRDALSDGSGSGKSPNGYACGQFTPETGPFPEAGLFPQTGPFPETGPFLEPVLFWRKK